jgi:hypothetical protein
LSFANKVANSWKLTRASFKVLLRNPKLIVYPAITFVVCVLILIGFVGYSYAMDAWIKETDRSRLMLVTMILIGSFITYFIMTFVAVLSNAAIVGISGMLLQGKVPTVKDGYTIALSRFGSLTIWAGMTSIVTFLSSFGRFFLSAVGIAWSVLTYFVIPVMIFEGVGPFKGVKRSKDILKARWGESLITNFGIWTVLSLIYLVLALIFLLLSLLFLTMYAVVLFYSMLLLLVITTFTFGLVGYTLKGILMASLYWYSVTGDPGFDIPEGPLKELFRKR